jgi:UDP-glucose 4-epimerase
MQRGLVVVTGADGFIGRALCAHLHATGQPHRALVRQASHGASASEVAIADLANAPDAVLDAALADAFAIVHLAGRAHVLDDTAPDPVQAYRLANVVATTRVLEAAARAGIQRFVHASTVKVHGEVSAPDRPLQPHDAFAPGDEYARSKLAAEEAVRAIGGRSGIASLILRLPLVYGPGVKGNFLALMDAVARGAMLPLGAIRNRRSILYVGNLGDAIVAALDATHSPVGAHFVADAQSVAVPALARAIGVALGEPARIVSVPVWMLALGAGLAGRRAAVERLTQTLEVDAASFTMATGWHPRYALAEGLAETAKWWRTRHAI